MSSFSTDVDTLKAFLRSGLSVSPWLMGANTTDRIDAYIFQELNAKVTRLIEREWTEDTVVRHYGTRPVPERVPQTAVYEIAASIAMSLALLRSPSQEIDEQIADAALATVADFTAKHSLPQLINVYGTVTLFENLSALAFYGEVPEREFILGTWHRPWIDYSISDELLLGAYYGMYAIRIERGRRFVVLTKAGKGKLDELRALLEASGYLRHRVKMLHSPRSYPERRGREFTRELWPDIDSLRSRFLSWSRASAGMRVLEICYGDGSVSLNKDLAMLVGPAGRLDVLGASAQATRTADVDWLRDHGEWVQFHHGHAELIPFPDETFDAVVAVGVLRHANADAVAREIARILKPGGHAASIHPLKVTDEQPFYRDWCMGIARSAVSREDEAYNFLLEDHQAVKAFQAAGMEWVETEHAQLRMVFHHSESVLHYLINGIGWLEQELAGLPWKARQRLLARLHEKSLQIWLQYAPEDRRISFPLQMLRAQKRVRM